MTKPIDRKLKSKFMSKEVRQIDLEKIQTVQELVESFKSSSIQSRNLGRCAAVYENMLTDKSRPTIILGLSGALIAGGLRKVIRDMIKYGMVDCVVSTGAVLFQDFYQSKGFGHYIGSPDMDDVKLNELAIDRIYDTLIDEEKVRNTDKAFSDMGAKLKPGIYSTRTFLAIAGKQAKDENSILYTAWKNNVPVFCPALNDSSIGIGLTELYGKMKKSGKKMQFMIDPIRDTYELTQIIAKSKKTAAVYVGGGVPKNYINDCTVINIGYPLRGHHYGFQITTDIPQWGGLSGSTLQEAQSWGKISKEATKATVNIEATIGLPLIVGYVLQKKLYKNRKRIKFVWNDDELKKIEYK
ncbi:MAG: deoxyhypusine synthase family protein [Thermoplasmata archaeon]